MDYLLKLIAPFGEKTLDGMIGLDNVGFGIVNTPSSIEFTAVVVFHKDTEDRGLWFLLSFFITVEFPWFQFVQQIP